VSIDAGWDHGDAPPCPEESLFQLLAYADYSAGSQGGNLRQKPSYCRTQPADARAGIQIASAVGYDQRKFSRERTKECGHRAEMRMDEVRTELSDFTSEPLPFSYKHGRRGPGRQEEGFVDNAQFPKSCHLPFRKNHRSALSVAGDHRKNTQRFCGWSLRKSRGIRRV